MRLQPLCSSRPPSHPLNNLICNKFPLYQTTPSHLTVRKKKVQLPLRWRSDGAFIYLFIYLFILSLLFVYLVCAGWPHSPADRASPWSEWCPLSCHPPTFSPLKASAPWCKCWRCNWWPIRHRAGTRCWSCRSGSRMWTPKFWFSWCKPCRHPSIQPAVSRQTCSTGRQPPAKKALE